MHNCHCILIALGLLAVCIVVNNRNRKLSSKVRYVRGRPIRDREGLVRARPIRDKEGPVRMSKSSNLGGPRESCEDDICPPVPECYSSATPALCIDAKSKCMQENAEAVSSCCTNKCGQFSSATRDMCMEACM